MHGHHHHHHSYFPHHFGYGFFAHSYGYPYYHHHRPHWYWYPSFGLGFAFGHHGGFSFGVSLGHHYDHFYSLYPYRHYSIYSHYPYRRHIVRTYPYYSPYSYVSYVDYNDAYVYSDYYSGFGPFRRTYYVVEAPDYSSSEASVVEPAPVGRPPEDPTGGLIAGDAASSLEPSVEALAGLTPAQQSFAYGYMHLRNANYQGASEAFYSATQEKADSRLAKAYLGLSLFGIGEYGFAADYFRLALADWPEFADYAWNVKALYPSDGADFAEHLALLREHIQLHPNDDDAALVHAIVSHYAGDRQHAADSFSLLALAADDPVSATIARRYSALLEARPADELAGVGAADGALSAFLEAPSLELVADLSME